jgi:hypothetical protein
VPSFSATSRRDWSPRRSNVLSAPPLGRAAGIDAHYILVRDHFAAAAFYTAVVGVQRSREVPRGAEYDLADGSTFGIVAY